MGFDGAKLQSVPIRCENRIQLSRHKRFNWINFTSQFVGVFFFGTFCYIFKSVWHIFIHFVFLYEFWTYETLLFFRQVCDSQGNLMMPDDASGADNFLDFVIYWCFLKIFSSGLRKIVFAFTIARFDYGPHAFPRIPSWPHFRCVFSHSFIYIYLFNFFKLPNLESRTSSTSARYSPQKNSEL